MELFRLDGKLALVTGSSMGLGYAMAEGLAEAGARIVLNARRAERLDEAAEALREKGHEVHTRRFDVSDERAVAEAVDDVETHIGPIEILVNNAGVNIRGMVEELTREDWRRLMAVNLDGAFYVSRAVGARMIERRRGKIVNVTSLASEISRPGIAPYAASKGGVKMLTKALAVEWAQYNIQVNAIGPGFFKTEMNRPLSDDPEFNAWVLRRAPAGRWGEGRDLVGAAVFFASPASDYVTGQQLHVDGGWLASP